VLKGVCRSGEKFTWEAFIIPLTLSKEEFIRREENFHEGAAGFSSNT